MNGRSTAATRTGKPPTTTQVGFVTGTEVSTSAPSVGVATTEVTTTEMTAVLAFFDTLELEYDGNLTPSQIQAAVAADVPNRLAEEFGASWGARVDDSEPVGNAWTSSGYSWVHPTKSGGVTYTHVGSDYTLPKIKVQRLA